MRVKRASHVGINVPEVEASVRFYEQIVGLEVSHRAGDTVYLRCNDEHHCLAIFPARSKGINHLGLELAGMDPLEEATATLRQRGIEVMDAPEVEPGHGPAIRFTDPDGNVIELHSGMEQIERPLAPREVRPRKLSHVNFRTRDLVGQMRFYLNILGFRLSDQIEDRAAWMRCNPDHHTVAFLRGEASTVHHYAYELDDWDAIKRFCDNLARNGGAVSWGPGRHGPGHNLFCYVGDNSGNIVELTADLDQIWDDGAHRPGSWKNELRTLSNWGSVPPGPQFMQGEP